MLTNDDDDDILKSDKEINMQCRCGYKWKPKIKKPKSCPKCKRYL